jgi:hypothetical protein
MATVVNLASNETLVKEAYTRVKGDWAALDTDQLLQVNLDVQLALQTVLGAWPEIKALRAKVAQELPAFEIAQFDKLEDYVLALMYVQSRYVMATQPPDDLADLVAEAAKLRDMLQADAQALTQRGLFDERKLAGLKGGNGYKNLAQDLQALANELEAALPNIQGKSALSTEELQAATQMATRLTRVVGVREQSPAVLAVLAEERLRAFTQMIKTYEDARSAVGFLRRREGDAEQIAPNLYTGNARRKKVSDPEATIPPAHQLITPLPGSVPAIALPAGAGTPPVTNPSASGPFAS